MMILLIDNYDSFTYNLVQLVAQQTEVRVIRNDALSVAEIASLAPDAIILSPGPGRPEYAGICVQIIRELGPSVPILGVCLGHQAIGYAFGANVIHAPELMHGKVSAIHHAGTGIYAGIPVPFPATRYHSLIIDRPSLPAELLITSTTDDGIIMGICHRSYPIEGIQFHPESILTTSGPALVTNWLKSRGHRV
jgi:anthranilate synthase component 2